MTRKYLCLILTGIVLFCALPHTGVADTPESSFPEYYLDECPEQGTVTSYTYKDGEELKVWTPYGYDARMLYEIVLLLHGDYGSLDSWLIRRYELFGHTTEGRNLFDWMAYERRTVPFIVVTLNNKPNDPVQMTADIQDALLFVAKRYSVYPKGTVESLIENRNHITVGGLSRGSMLTHWFLCQTPEIAGNCICMSAAGPYTEIPEALESRQVRLRKLFTAVGTEDEEFYAMTKRSYALLAPYADESLYREYPHGHNWYVWLPGVYDALLFVLPQYSIDYWIRCAARVCLEQKTVPLPHLFFK